MKMTRLFTLIWDNSKIPNLEYETRFHPRQCDGVHFATGIVALDNGVMYESMSQLERNLTAYGKCHVEYHDEERDTDERVVMVPRIRSQKKR